MEKITYQDLKKTFPEEKKSVESLYGRIIPVRQISYYVTLPLLRRKVTAFQASIMGLLLAVIACVLISAPNNIARVLGVILVPIWHVFDCVDGNIARYRKTASDFGSAVDAICGYFIAFLPFALGIASYNINSNYFHCNPAVFIILGGIATSSNIMMRLIHQKYAFEAQSVEIKTGRHFEKGENQYTLTGFHKLRKKMMVELGPVGLPMFVLWLCPVFNLYHILTTYYALFYLGSLFVATCFYLRKCNKGN